MGVDLGELAQRHTVSISELSGKTFAVDAYNTIFQFLSSIRQSDGTPLMDSQGKVTGHLSGLFYRNARLLGEGLKLVYVFDGKPNILKKKTVEERQKRREEATVKWHAAVEQGDIEGARKYAQATSKLTPEMVQESKQLLLCMGIPVVDAPSEGEAQASVLAQEGKVHAVASQDYDALLFGAPLLLRNLTISGKRKVPRKNEYVDIEPEMVDLQHTLSESNLAREQLVHMGMLVGTDFNVGVPKVGPKTALKIVQEKKTLEEIQKYLKEKYNYEFEVDAAEVEALFLKPQAHGGLEIKFAGVQKDALQKLLCETHDFSLQRVENAMNSIIAKEKEKGSQSRLGDW
ncbi:flap endonuclease-1 [Candidatus Micrarchaeota archaeon]|nr:flap endonuclease-1 [Candidatus Micrarchaeota archaeon]